MAPHDLLCKWCSTFVGKDKSFCSIFCESRFTRSKKRKLAFKRPSHASGIDGHYTEYESPRNNKTAPAKREAFLEDVITAMRMDGNKNQRPNDPSDNSTSAPNSSHTDKDIPKLHLGDLKDKKDKRAITPRVERTGTKIPIRNKTVTLSRSALHRHTIDSNKNENHEKPSFLKSDKDKTPNPKLADTIKDSPYLTKDNHDSLKKDNTLTQFKRKTKSNVLKDLNGFEEVLDSQIPVQKIKSTTEMEKRVRSSGYGAPVNPNLRPRSLKPRSATLASKVKRETSASSTRSAAASLLPVLTRERSRPINAGQHDSKWELIPSTIQEEKTQRTVEETNNNIVTTLENEDPIPKTAPKSKLSGYGMSAVTTPRSSATGTAASSTSGTSRSSETTTSRSSATNTTRSDVTVASELSMLREESTASDFLDQTKLQERLSSIKRKVEVKKRGRDSRSSIGSDMDNSFMDSTGDLTLDSSKTKPTTTSRFSARSNITRISQQFRIKEN